jgi:hypothetical protein
VVIAPAEVERAIARMFIAAEGTALRREDRKKAVEVAALLSLLGPPGEARLLVDAAAGKACAGLLAAELCGWSRLVVIERDPSRIAACRAAAAHLRPGVRADLREGDVADPALWPAEPDAVVALHACGPASDATIDASARARARWIYLVPCCYGAGIPFAAAAEARAEALGVPRQAEVRRAFVTALIDAERTLRLEAAGYEVTVLPFVPRSVTPHNLLWRARRAGEPTRMGEARARLDRLYGRAAASA